MASGGFTHKLPLRVFSMALCFPKHQKSGVTVKTLEAVLGFCSKGVR